MRNSFTALAAMLMVSATSVHATEEGGNLAGKQLRTALSGKTIYLQTPVGSEVPIRYRPNGTMTGSSSKQLAMLAGEDVHQDRGRWWIRQAQLCQKWNNWSDGRAYCYRLTIKGSAVSWIRSDGKSGTARLGQ